MRKELLFLLLMAFIYTKAQAQTGIGTTSPNADAALEIKSTNKGILIPRLPLESTTSPVPLSAHVAGMLIYNTATSGSAPNKVNPGSYFNDGTKWVRVANAADGDKTDDAWINEYSDDDDATNDLVKLGTLSDGTTARPAAAVFLIRDNGRVGIGTATPSTKLHIKGNALSDSTVTAQNYVAKIQDITGTWDLSKGSNAIWNLATGSNTLTISNAKAGMYGMLKLVNAGTSNITLPMGSKVVNNGGGTVWLTQATGAVDILTFFYDGTNYYWTYGNNYN